jgi:hypothetical protein
MSAVKVKPSNQMTNLEATKHLHDDDIQVLNDCEVQDMVAMGD